MSYFTENYFGNKFAVHGLASNEITVHAKKSYFTFYGKTLSHSRVTKIPFTTLMKPQKFQIKQIVASQIEKIFTKSFSNKTNDSI